MKEIAGHMIDVTELFLERLRRILTAETPQSLSTPVPPWKILEGRGYTDTPVQELESVAEPGEAPCQSRLRHKRARPALVQEFVFRNHPVAMGKEIEENLQHFGFKGDEVSAPP